MYGNQAILKKFKAANIYVYELTYLLTYLLHGAESFLRS